MFSPSTKGPRAVTAEKCTKGVMHVQSCCLTYCRSCSEDFQIRYLEKMNIHARALNASYTLQPLRVSDHNTLIYDTFLLPLLLFFHQSIPVILLTHIHNSWSCFCDYLAIFFKFTSSFQCFVTFLFLSALITKVKNNQLKKIFYRQWLELELKLLNIHQIKVRYEKWQLGIIRNII